MLALLVSPFTLTNCNTSPYHLASFSSAWTGLSSVTFSSPTSVVAVFQLDDIAVTADPLSVPLPAALTLVATGLCAYAVQRRPRRTRP